MTSAAKVQDLLANIKAAQQRPLGDPRLEGLIGLEKSTFTENASATSGLTFYDLEVGAKLLYPVLTPLRNAIPRVSGKGGIQANWRAITAINTSGLRFGVSAANRGGALAVATQDYTATYKGIGVETSVDFEAQYAGQGFDDIRAIAAKTGLEALMLGEEAMILGGNAFDAARHYADAVARCLLDGRQRLRARRFRVICRRADARRRDERLGRRRHPGAITRTNADGSSDTFGGGAAKQSANATVSVTGRPDRSSRPSHGGEGRARLCLVLGRRRARKCSAPSRRSTRWSSPPRRPARRPRPRLARATIRPTRWLSMACIYAGRQDRFRRSISRSSPQARPAPARR